MTIKQGRPHRFLTIQDYRSLRYSRLFLILHCISVCFIIILQVFAFPFQIIRNGSSMVLWMFYLHVCMFTASQLVLFKALRKSISVAVFAMLTVYVSLSILSTTFTTWTMFKTISNSSEEYVITIIGPAHIDVTQRIILISIISFFMSCISSSLLISSFIFYKFSYSEHKKFKHWLRHGTVRNNLLLMNQNDKHVFECTDAGGQALGVPASCEKNVYEKC
ncbi:AaceriAER393WAp [[Ashbya] aceris (nom. inval.)]|nr:AaceriAER393WAp [[Ashbya] aceris (nom. inval.)]